MDPSKRTELKFLEALIRFNTSKVCVEVGVAKGSAALHICRAAEANQGHYHGFDIWQKHGQKAQFSQVGDKEIVGNKLKDAGLTKWTLHQVDTINNRAEFAKLCPKIIDFAFIDACHSYIGIQSDFSVIYPRLAKSHGVIVFHDTHMCDGCREFMLDLRTKYYDGTFDLIDFPYGAGKSRAGLSVLVKRMYPVIDRPIIECCGSPSRLHEIEKREAEEYEARVAKYVDVGARLEKDVLAVPNIYKDKIGKCKSRAKFQED